MRTASDELFSIIIFRVEHSGSARAVYTARRRLARWCCFRFKPDPLAIHQPPALRTSAWHSYRKCYITSFNLLLQKRASEQFHGKEVFFTVSLHFFLFFWDSITSDLFWIVVKQPIKLPKLISAISKVRGFTFCRKWSPRDFVSNFLQIPYNFQRNSFNVMWKWLLVASHWHWVCTL